MFKVTVESLTFIFLGFLVGIGIWLGDAFCKIMFA